MQRMHKLAGHAAPVSSSTQMVLDLVPVIRLIRVLRPCASYALLSPNGGRAASECLYWLKRFAQREYSFIINSRTL